jgi:hypothetical protein
LRRTVAPAAKITSTSGQDQLPALVIDRTDPVLSRIRSPDSGPLCKQTRPGMRPEARTPAVLSDLQVRLVANPDIGSGLRGQQDAITDSCASKTGPTPRRHRR